LVNAGVVALICDDAIGVVEKWECHWSTWVEHEEVFTCWHGAVDCTGECLVVCLICGSVGVIDIVNEDTVEVNIRFAGRCIPAGVCLEVFLMFVVSLVQTQDETNLLFRSKFA